MEKLYQRPDFKRANSNRSNDSLNQSRLHQDCEPSSQSGNSGSGNNNQTTEPHNHYDRNRFKLRLKAVQGLAGADGKDGKDGKDGLSAYDIAVKHGFTGTEKEWLDSLQPPNYKGLPDLVRKWLKLDEPEKTTP